MTSRERIMAMTVLGLLLVVGGGVCGYMFLYSPLQDKKKAAADLQKDVEDLDLKVLGMQKAAPLVAEAKRQSLPPDRVEANKTPSFNVARAQYKLMLERLLSQAGIKDFKIPKDTVTTAGRPPVTPEMAPKKPAYTTLSFTVEIPRADIWQIVDFLYGYYQLDLLHQITDIKISRENRVYDARGGLKAVVTCEAIVLDGAEPRTSLFPVSSAVAAVGGNLATQAIIAKPEMLRRLTNISSKPILATPRRDYSLIALKDIFYGPIPPYVEKPNPFTIAKIDDVRMGRDEKPKEARVRFSGEGATGAKLVASAEGSLIPEGALTVDPKTNTIAIPAIDNDAPDSATSTVTVLATSSTGIIKKTTFAVSVERSREPIVPKPFIDTAIRLVIVSTASDGTAEVMIKDNANPFRYIISSTKKGLEIAKWWRATEKTWKRDRDYDYPPGVLLISDEETATKRMFKVVAIELDALVVSEIVLPEPAKEVKQPPGGGMGFRPPAGPVKKERANPLAAVAGNLAAAIPQPTYYRWNNGKSLKELQKLTPDEVKKVLNRVNERGPSPGMITAGN